jgi:hypothetical protein
MCDLCALLRNDGDLGVGKCNEYMSCSVIPAHVNPGCDEDQWHPQVLPNKDTVQTLRPMHNVWDVEQWWLRLD